MIIVTLDGDVIDQSAPFVFADDLGILRGDGIFETLLMRLGKVCLLEEHLQRLTYSAQLMQLTSPNLDLYRAAIERAIAEFPTHCGEEAIVRLIYTRGREHQMVPTGYVMIDSLPQRVYQARNRGVTAMTLSRGYELAAASLPWLLTGAKTLSYSVNMAALRYAESHQIDEVIFLSNDGYVLEGPRSTVILGEAHQGFYRLLSPPPTHPILGGTTQKAVFKVAKRHGWECQYCPISQEQLRQATDIWLVSSVTLAARVRSLDQRKVTGKIDDDVMTMLVEEAITG